MVGNTVAVVVVAIVLRRLTAGRLGLTRVTEVLAFVAAAVVAAGVSAAFGPASLLAGDVVDDYTRVLRTWFLSDLSGALVVTPVVLAWAHARLGGLERRRVVEGLLLLAALALMLELPSQRDVPYVVFPLFIWAALRFGPRGAATAVAIVSGVTVWNTAQEAGPFVRDSITDSLLATQLFIAIAALTSLVLAAVTAERTRAGAELADAYANSRPRGSGSSKRATPSGAGSSETCTTGRSSGWSRSHSSSASSARASNATRRRRARSWSASRPSSTTRSRSFASSPAASIRTS